MSDIIDAIDTLAQARKKLGMLACYLADHPDTESDEGAAFVASDILDDLRSVEDLIEAYRSDVTEINYQTIDNVDIVR